jgi:hypothetical protein
MKKIKIINSVIRNNKLLQFDRLYIGNDYCEENFKVNNIKKIICAYKNKKITLLLPFLTDLGIKKLYDILTFLNKFNLKDFEIVFNDWGTFFFLKKYYPKTKLILGRLLTKQRKDPRIEVILKNKQDSFKILKNCVNNNVVRTKLTPPSLLDLFSRNVIESEEITNFLLENNILRIEIDNLAWDMFSNLSKKIKVSMYYPYVLLNVTRYCGAINGKYEKICNKDCLNTPKYISENIFMKGNSLYYKNIIIPNKNVLKSNNIDRIIYQEL